MGQTCGCQNRDTEQEVQIVSHVSLTSAKSKLEHSAQHHGRQTTIPAGVVPSANKENTPFSCKKQLSFQQIMQ